MLMLIGSPFTVGEVEKDVSPKQLLGRGTMHQAPMATQLGPPRSPACSIMMIASPVLSVPSSPIVSTPQPVYNMAATPESSAMMAATSEPTAIMVATPEPPMIVDATPDPPAIMDATPEYSAVMDATSVFLVAMNVTSEAVKASPGHLRLASSLAYTPLTLVRAAGGI